MDYSIIPLISYVWLAYATLFVAATKNFSINFAMAEPQAEPLPAQVPQDSNRSDDGGLISEYFVVSIGLQSRLYHELLAEVHNLREVVVDVRHKIKAPPKGLRIKAKCTLMLPW